MLFELFLAGKMLLEKMSPQTLVKHVDRLQKPSRDPSQLSWVNKPE